jgi:hypothetical protein|tara:strand:+ start:907 stop:1062 length:156 start_codon:yes stop_codon:yes gene_type:complete
MVDELVLIEQLKMIKRIVESGKTELAAHQIQGIIELNEQKVEAFEKEHAYE